MRTYSVAARGLPTVSVDARSWITALGLGLEELGRAEDIERFACEVLPNGTVIARDITTGTGFIVQMVSEHETPAPAPRREVAPSSGPSSELEACLEQLSEATTVTGASQLALQIAAGLITAESGAVILEERGYLRFMAVSGPHAEELVGVRLPMGTGVAGFAMRTRRPVVVGDASEDKRHCGEVDSLTGYQTRDMAVVPVVAGEHSFGVLELMNLPEGGRFSRQDISRLQVIGQALGEHIDGM